MSLKPSYKNNLHITTRIILLIIIAQSCIFFSCRKRRDEVVLKVNSLTLTKSELESILIEKNIPSDSASMVYQYLKTLAIEQLLIEYAENNIYNKEYVDSMVAGFRQSLIVSMYEDQLVKERLESKLTAEQL